MAVSKQLSPAKYTLLDSTKLHSVAMVTNEMVLDLHSIMNHNPEYTYCTLRQWLLVLFGKRFQEKDFPSAKAIRQNVLRLCARLSKLKKERNCLSKGEKIQRFFQEEYCLPQAFISNGEVHKVSASLPCFDKVLQAANVELCRDLTKMQLENESKEEKLTQLRHKMYSMHRNTARKIARKEKTITLQAKENAEKKRAIEYLHVKLTSLEPKIEYLQKERECLRHRAAYWKRMASQLKSSYEDQIVDDIVKQQKQSLKLAEEVDQLVQDNADLQQMVDEAMKPNHKLVTFCDGKYTDNVRACCYELLSLNVGVNNVVPIIKTVLQSFTDKVLDRMPSKTLLCNMMIECLTLAQAQLGEELTIDDTGSFTIQTDGIPPNMGSIMVLMT